MQIPITRARHDLFVFYLPHTIIIPLYDYSIGEVKFLEDKFDLPYTIIIPLYDYSIGEVKFLVDKFDLPYTIIIP